MPLTRGEVRRGQVKVFEYSILYEGVIPLDTLNLMIIIHYTFDIVESEIKLCCFCLHQALKILLPHIEVFLQRIYSTIPSVSIAVRSDYY